MKKSDKTSRSYRKSIVNSIAKKLFRDSSRGLEALEPRQMLSGVALTNMAASELINNGENSFTVQAVSSEYPDGGQKVYTGFAFYTESGEQVEGFRISKITDANGNDATGKLIDPNAAVQRLISYNVAELDLNQQYTMQIEWNGTGEAPKFTVAAYMMGDLSSFTNYQYGYSNASLNGDALNNSLSAFVSQEEVAYAMASRFSGVSTNWNGSLGSFNGYTISKQAAPLKSFVLSTDKRVDPIDVERIQNNASLGYVDFQVSFDNNAPIVYMTDNTGVGSFNTKDAETANVTVNVYANNSKPTLELLVQDEKTVDSVTLTVSGTSKGDLMTLTTEQLTALGITLKNDSTDASNTTDYINIARFGVNLTTLFGLDNLADGSTYTFSLTVTDAMSNTATYTYNIAYQLANAYVVSSDDSKASVDKPINNVTDGSQVIVVDPAFAKSGDAALVDGETTKQRVILYTYPSEGGASNGTYVTSDYITFTYNSTTGKWTHPTLTLKDFFQVDGDGAITETTLAKALDTNSDGKCDDGVYLMTFALADQFGHDAQAIGHEETSEGAADATNLVTMQIDTVAPAFTVTVNGTTVENGGELKIANRTDNKSAVAITLNAADATKVTVALATDNKAEIAVGDTAANLTITSVYGATVYTLTATDEAGNVVTKSFTVYYNTIPTAAEITLSMDERQTLDSALTATDYKEISFADYIDDNGQTADAGCSVTITAASIDQYGSLYTKSGDVYTKVASANGQYTFAGDAVVYFLPKLYLNTAETTITYAVTDNDTVNGELTQTGNIKLTITAVATNPVITWNNPTAQDEDTTTIPTSTSNGVIIGSFVYNASEASTRTWAYNVTTNADKSGVHQLNDGSDTITDNLMTLTSESFAIADSGQKDAYGNTIYNIVMLNWTQSANLWGTQGFTISIGDGAVTSNVGDLTYTVNSVNDAPVAGTQKQFNVSLSGLAKNDVTLKFDDTMFSDTDDAYAKLSVSKAVLTIGESSITLTTAAPTASLTINNVETTFTLNAVDKTIVITANNAEALDKAVVSVAYTVSDGQKTTDISGSTVKFSAYASDDEVSMNEDGGAKTFNVLRNDQGEYVDDTDPPVYANWGDKHFEITHVNGTAISEGGTVELMVDGVKAGVLTLSSKSSVAFSNFSFTPEANWNGVVTFEYTITSGGASPESATATVTITVNPINDYPTFAWNTDTETGLTINGTSASKAVDEDADKMDEGAFSGQIILGTYTDIDSAVAALNAALASNRTLSQYGTISGTVPTTAADSSLFDSWSLTVNDNFQLVFACTLKDYAYGNAVLKFTPTDEATDGSQGTAPVEHTFTLTVNPLNDEPEANNKTITVLEDADYTEITLDFGSDKDIYDVESPKANLQLQVKAPTSGKLYIRTGEEGAYVYTEMAYTEGLSAWMAPSVQIFYKPNANDFGTDSFQYQIKDSGTDAGLAAANDAESGFADFTINVTAVNDAPVITPNTGDSGLFEEGTADDLGKYVLKTNLTEQATPTANQTINLGKVSDVDNALTDLTIKVKTVSEDGGHKFTDKSDDPMALFASAEFTVNASGDLIFTYTLADHVYGYADIDVQMNDGALDSNSVSYRLYVDAVNDAPTATDATWNVSIGALEKVSATSPVVFDFGPFIADVDGDALEFNLVTNNVIVKRAGVTTDITAKFSGTKADLTLTLTLSEGNTIVLHCTYGNKTFTVTSIETTGTATLDDLDKLSIETRYVAEETERDLASNVSMFTIKFSAYTQDDSATYDEVSAEGGKTRTIDVLTNDSPNWAGKTFTITGVSALSDTNAGSIAIVDGMIQYNQAKDYRGTFTFTYTITETVEDGVTPETAEGTVTVVVNAFNHVPTAGQVDATINESQTGTDKVQLDFANAVADKETADGNLTINIDVSDVSDGTLVDGDGTALVATDGYYTFSAAATVYFKPTQYYNGSVTIPYTVTDRLSDVPTPTITGETDKSATSNVVVVVNAVVSEPIVEWNDTNSYTVKEDNEDFALTQDIALGTVKFPANESVSLLLSSSGDNGGLFNNPDGFHMFKLSSEPTVDGLYNVWTVYMNKDYTLTANANGTCNFTLQIKIGETNKGTAKTFAFNVTAVNDAPTTNGLNYKGTVSGTTGSWSMSEADLKAAIVAASQDVDGDTLTVTIDNATLPTGMTYADGTYTLAATDLSATYTINYTVSDGIADAVAGKVDITFNQACVIEGLTNGTSVKTVNLDANSGTWELFDASAITNPGGIAIPAENISVTNMTLTNGKYVMSYSNLAAFSSKTATIAITDPEDSTLVTKYEFKVVCVNNVTIAESEQPDMLVDVAFDNSALIASGVKAENITVYQSKAYNTVNNVKQINGSDTLNLNTLFGNAAGDYSVTIKSDTDETKTWDLSTCSTDAACPFVVTIDASGNLKLEIKPYRAEQYRTFTFDITETNSNATVSVNVDFSLVQTICIMTALVDAGTAASMTQGLVSASTISTTLSNYVSTSTAIKANNIYQYQVWISDKISEGSFNTASQTNEYYNGLGILPCEITLISNSSNYKLNTNSLSTKQDLGTMGLLDRSGMTYSLAALYNPMSLQSGSIEGQEQWFNIATISYSYSVVGANQTFDGVIPTLTIATVKDSSGNEHSVLTRQVVLQSYSIYDEVSGEETMYYKYETLDLAPEQSKVMQYAGESKPFIYGTESAEQTKVEGTGVYMQLTTDAPTAQKVDELPQSESWINEWQSHYVNLYANTQDATIIDGRVSFALNYDPAYFTATDFVAGDALLGGKIEYVDGKAYITGLADNLDASDGFVLLGSVKFESLGDNGVAASTIGSVDMGLSLSNIVLNNADGEQIAVNTQTVVDTRLWAVVYDANDDGAINMADFIQFATYFNTNTIVSNDALAWALDFDKSGSVNMTDFIQFAQNFNVSRANGQKVNFADGFVQEYIGTKLSGEGDTNLRDLVDKAVDEWESKLGIELDVNIQIKVVDYDGKQLGSSYIVDLAENGTPATGVITLDSDAAGLRWSIAQNEIYFDSASGNDMYDLYTVILHEIGHLLGYSDQYSAFNETTKDNSDIANGHNVTDSSDLMYSTIEPGERKNVSSDNAQLIKDAYDYAADNGAELTYEGTTDLAAAMTGTVAAPITVSAATVSTPTVSTPTVEIASGMVSQSAWTETVTAKVSEEVVRIENEVRKELFFNAAENAATPVQETNPSNDFVQNLAANASEEDDLFIDLSWLDDQPSGNQDADEQSQYPFGEI